jgi:hypothetical protein
MMDCFASASQELRFMSDLCRSNGFEHSLKICDICGCGKEMKRPPKKAFLPGGLWLHYLKLQHNSESRAIQVSWPVVA